MVLDRHGDRAAERSRGRAPRPHPHAAVLFYDFEISEEGQKILAQRDFVPTKQENRHALNKLPLKFVDARVTLDEYESGSSCTRRFRQGTVNDGRRSKPMGKESHYSSKKDRVFVRGIQGQYSLKEELARLRGLRA